LEGAYPAKPRGDDLNSSLSYQAGILFPLPLAHFFLDASDF